MKKKPKFEFRRLSAMLLAVLMAISLMPQVAFAGGVTPKVTALPNTLNVSEAESGTAVALESNVAGTMYVVSRVVNPYTNVEDLNTAKIYSSPCTAEAPVAYDTGGMPAGQYQIYIADENGTVSAPADLTIKPVLTAAANNEKNYVELSWISNNSSDHFMIYQKDADGNDVYQTIPAKSNIRVLNVYPDANFSDNLKAWMETPVSGESYTLGSPNVDGVPYAMTVDKVSLSTFNGHADTYLKDENGKYQYDAVYFGAADGNNNMDLGFPNYDDLPGMPGYGQQDDTLKKVKDFLDYGGGVLIGHDTAMASHPNFMSLAQGYLNMAIDGGNAYGDSYGDNVVVVKKRGMLTNFPYSLGDIETQLHTPMSHSYHQFAMGDVWFKYRQNKFDGNRAEITSSGSSSGTNNFYLTTWNNCAMVQTGHSASAEPATLDEQKIIVNTLYYLSQVTTENEAADHMSQDLAGPDAVDTGTLSVGGGSASWTAPADKGSSYLYKLKEVSPDGSSVVESDEASATVTTGVDHYFVLIDHNSSVSASTVKTSGIERTSASADISTLNAETNYYIHIIAVDKAGNESAVSTSSFTTPPPRAVTPVISTQPADQTVAAGSTAVFSVAVSSPSSGNTYQWRKSTDGGNNWTDIEGATSASLSVSEVSAAENHSLYCCVITNTVGETHETATSNAASLTVTYPVTINTRVDGTAKEITGEITFRQGGVIKAAAEGNPETPGTYGASLPSGTYSIYAGNKDTGKTVTVSNGSITAEPLNYYTVSYGAVDRGLASGSSVTAMVGEVEIESGEIVLAGQQIVLTAAGHGESANSFSYLWTVGGVPGQNSAELTLTVGGTVNAYCTVTGSASYSVTLNVSGGAINSGNITNYNYGSAVALPTNLTLANATFAGWYSNSDFSGQRVTEIGADETGNKTYYAKWVNTVIYSSNYSGGATYSTRTDVIHNVAMVQPEGAPTREGYHFTGWYKDTACLDPWSFTSDTVTKNITLYAGWAKALYSVTGTIVDETPSPVAGATVTLMKGNTQFASDTTNSTGGFELKNVPDGTYNLVVSSGNGKTVTTYVTVTGGVLSPSSVTLPGHKLSALEVMGNDTPSVVVDGLNQQFSSDDNTAIGGGATVKITLKVENKGTSAPGVSDIQSKAANQIIDMYLDMSVYHQVNTNIPTSLSTVPNLLKIVIPYDLTGKSNVTIYRYHNGSTETMPNLSNSAAVPSTEGYMLDTANHQIIIWAKNFSTYAIAYSTGGFGGGSSSGSGGSSKGTFNIAVTVTGKGGSISPSGTVSVTKGGTKTFQFTPEEGYVISNVLIDGKGIGAVNSYTFENITEAHTLSVVFEKASGLPYYYNGSNQKVFIGFADDASGTMKYIAPDGKTVLLQPNPKDFRDIGGHWGKAYINFVTEREIFVGTADKIFSPDTSMTRAMLATVIGRLYERSYGPLKTVGAHGFTDCNYGSWYGSYIDWCSENGIIQGVGGGLFQPDRKVTRQEMAAMLYRFAGFMKAAQSNSSGTALNYSDADEISSWAKDAARYCQDSKIITGRDGGSFAPKETATRAEVAAILERFIKKVIQ